MLAIKAQTYWHDCVVYGGYAPFAAKLNKGTHIVIEGELTYREGSSALSVQEGEGGNLTGSIS